MPVIHPSHASPLTPTRTSNLVTTSHTTTPHVRTSRGISSRGISSQGRLLLSQLQQVDDGADPESEEVSQSTLDLLIENYGLQSDYSAILAIVRLASPGEYVDEFAKLGIPVNVAANLAKATTLDMNN